MIYFNFKIYFFIIFLQFLIPISKALPYFQTDDEGFVAFAKGQQNFDKFCEEKGFRNCEYSAKKYEAHLGILYWMRENWNCAKIKENFERKKCQKYRKYLDILYEYLFREFAGFPSVKPKFMLKNGEFENVGPLIYAVNSLAGIWKFYFQTRYSAYNYYIYSQPKPNLMNLHKLNFETKKLDNSAKVTNDQHQEMDIVQLAIDLDNQTQTNESVDGFLRKNFEKKLEKMYLKAKERAMTGLSPRAVESFDNYYIILDSKFDDLWTWESDKNFIEFLKGNTTNSERYIEKTFGRVYLLRENWYCEKIGNDFKENEREKCQKYRKYLDILYEYLFRQFAKAKCAEIGRQIPAEIKPIFYVDEYSLKIIEVVDILYIIWEYFFKLEPLLDYFSTFTLLNEGEINFYGQENSNFYGQENSEKTIFMAKMSENKVEKMLETKKQIFYGPSPTKIDNLREEFDKILKEMTKFVKQN